MHKLLFATFSAAWYRVTRYLRFIVNILRGLWKGNRSEVLDPEDLNNIPLRTIQKDLEEGWGKIVDITAFLFADTLPPNLNDHKWRRRIPIKGRFAPSIIVRSELGVFGFSIPRFCYRLNFNDTEDFVNCRRLKTFKKQIQVYPDASWGVRDNNLGESQKNPEIIEPTGNHPSPEMLSRSSCIADCLFSPPKRFERSYQIITVDLDREYGEQGSAPPGGERTARRGKTPFVKAVHFGGGLCAQASCFVCTAILHHYAKAVYGLSEITALASNPHWRELLIAGLDTSEMVAYFEKVNLSAIVQFSNPYRYLPRFKVERDIFFGKALQAYIASRMPVILLVDQRRLNGIDIEGQSIYQSNFYKISSPPIASAPHTITVIGCSFEKNVGSRNAAPSTDRHFLFHDSSAMPFMHATLQQLAQVGIFEAGVDLPSDMSHPTLLPVTPRMVKMPLLRWRDSLNNTRPGLLEIAWQNYNQEHDLKSREFLLAKIKRLPLLHIARHFADEYRKSLAEFVINTLAEKCHAAFSWAQDHWVWLECGTNFVKVWDAEAEPLTFHADQYLRAVIQIIDLHLECSLGQPTAASAECPDGPASLPDNVSREPEGSNKPDAVPSVQKEKRLVPSLISSFTVCGTEKSISFWPARVQNVEYYACMHHDLRLFFPDFFARWPVNAVRALSGRHRSRNPAIASRFADKLKCIFRGKSIVAIATFIPEILAHHEQVWQSAQEAIMFLVEVARHLKSGTTPFVIELVSGSNLHGVWEAQTQQGPYLAVNRLEQFSAIELLLDRLLPIAKFANTGVPIQLALELEPGPLFSIRDRSSLLYLCSHLAASSSNPDLRKIVGLNLDIPHWAFLSDIPLDWLRGNEGEVVRNRIIHAHISDHSKGHFCDNTIRVFHSAADFEGWIDFLHELAVQPRPGDCPNFSGFISCEMEACKSAQFLDRSVQHLQSFL